MPLSEALRFVSFPARALSRHFIDTQLNGHRLEFEWCPQVSVSAAEVAGSSDRDL
jgi:hypothetical protein